MEKTGTKIMQMNQYENAIYAATEALGKLNAESEKDFTITREESTPVTAPTEQKHIRFPQNLWDMTRRR